jgi:hypothetical protein
LDQETINLEMEQNGQIPEGFFSKLNRFWLLCEKKKMIFRKKNESHTIGCNRKIINGMTHNKTTANVYKRILNESKCIKTGSRLDVATPLHHNF